MTFSIVVKHQNHDTFCHHQALEPCHFLPPSCACGSLGGQKLSATGQHSGRHFQPISELEDRAHTPPADPRRPQHPHARLTRVSCSGCCKRPHRGTQDSTRLAVWNCQLRLSCARCSRDSLSLTSSLSCIFFYFFIFFERGSLFRGAGIANGNLVKVGTKTRQPCSFSSRLKGER